MDKFGTLFGGVDRVEGIFRLSLTYINKFCIVLCGGLGSDSVRSVGGINRNPHKGDTESVEVCG